MRVPWWLAALMLGALGLLIPIGPLAVFVYALAAAWIGAAWVVRRAAGALRFDQRVAPTHVPAGETIHIDVVVTNRSHLPVPWVWWQQALPVQLETETAFGGRTAIAPGGQAAFGFVLRPRRRGRYRIGTFRYHHGDWFGLHTLEAEAALPAWITVYPTVRPVPPLPLRPLVPTGPRRDPASPFRDELTAGLRPYRAGDPLRHIAWKASARRGELQVREFPPVRDRSLSLALDLEAATWEGRAWRREVERLLSLAASYIWAPPGGAHPVGLLTFAGSVRYVPEGVGVETEAGRLVRVTPRGGLAHRRHLLEILSGLQPGPAPPLAELLLAHGSGLAFGEAILILTGGYRPALWEAAGILAVRHHPVRIVTVDGRAPPDWPGVPTCGVTLEGAIRWL